MLLSSREDSHIGCLKTQRRSFLCFFCLCCRCVHRHREELTPFPCLSSWTSISCTLPTSWSRVGVGRRHVGMTGLALSHGHLISLVLVASKVSCARAQSHTWCAIGTRIVESLPKRQHPLIRATGAINGPGIQEFSVMRSWHVERPVMSTGSLSTWGKLEVLSVFMSIGMRKQRWWHSSWMNADALICSTLELFPRHSRKAFSYLLWPFLVQFQIGLLTWILFFKLISIPN